MPSSVEQEFERLDLPHGDYPFSSDAVHQVEDFFSLSLPEDFKWFVEASGCASLNSPLLVRVPVVRSGEIRAGLQREFWQAMPIELALYDDRLDLLAHTYDFAAIDAGTDQPWSSQVIPISDLIHGHIWCLDIRYDRVSPPVVRIAYEGAIPQFFGEKPLPMLWIEYVAPTFTQMLRQSLYNPQITDEELKRLYELNSTMYEFSEEALAWQQSTENYLQQFGPVASRLV